MLFCPAQQYCLNGVNYELIWLLADSEQIKNQNEKQVSLVAITHLPLSLD